ncbi:MAG: hypothetical protein IJI41_06830 [Anaerolineaceae bacterium]|nr:hypothetical protein [Anaerolineaceae bacterium]
MEYRYRGNFRTDETGYNAYRPAKAKAYFYCGIYPGEKNPETSLFDYGNQSVRVRIIPYTTHSVEIAGWDGVFDILPFNSGYAVLDNAGSGGKPHRKALIAMADIHRNFLEIKE